MAHAMLDELADTSQRVILGRNCGALVSGQCCAVLVADRNIAMITAGKRRTGLAILEAGQR